MKLVLILTQVLQVEFSRSLKQRFYLPWNSTCHPDSLMSYCGKSDTFYCTIFADLSNGGSPCKLCLNAYQRNHTKDNFWFCGMGIYFLLLFKHLLLKGGTYCCVAVFMLCCKTHKFVKLLLIYSPDTSSGQLSTHLYMCFSWYGVITVLGFAHDTSKEATVNRKPHNLLTLTGCTNRKAWCPVSQPHICTPYNTACWANMHNRVIITWCVCVCVSK